MPPAPGATSAASLPSRRAPAPPPSPLAADRLADNQRSFATALGRAGIGPAKPQTDMERARDTSEQFVAQTLVLPLLKQLRDTNQAAPPFAPTQGEKQFNALRDAELAHRIAHATHFPLVDRLARDLLKRAGKDSAGRDAATELLARPTPSPSSVPALNLGAATLASHD